MPAGVVLFNQLLTPHWVQSPLDAVAFSINLSHGGLRRVGAGRQLCRNEVQLFSCPQQLLQCIFCVNGLRGLLQKALARSLLEVLHALRVLTRFSELLLARSSSLSVCCALTCSPDRSLTESAAHMHICSLARSSPSAPTGRAQGVYCVGSSHCCYF